MAERVPAAIALREEDRKEIEAQIQAFLEKGGKIQQLPLNCYEAKPLGKIWRPSNVASLDQL